MDTFNSSGKLYYSCRKPGNLDLGDVGLVSAMDVCCYDFP